MRYSVHDVETCAVKVTVGLISGKWKPLILFHLSEGPLRFSELWRAIPRVSKKVLLNQLRELDAAGLIDRTVRNGFPLEVQYSLSPKGASLVPLLDSLEKWALANLDGVVRIAR